MKPTFVILSQVYVPDPAAVGQYVADAAAEMARRGYRTVVYTSRNGYDDATQVYPKREVRDGVEIRRLPFSSFGKDSMKSRLVAQIIFLLQAMVHSFFTSGLCGLMVSTSPPACGIGGAIVSLLRRVPIKFWVMDLNPDQLVVMNVLPAKAWPVRLFNLFNWAILRQARDIIVLDRFMAERVAAKATVAHKIRVMPLWPLQDQVHHMPHAGNSFRQQHVPAGRFLLMYSGNHSPANPLKTLLEAAQQTGVDPRLLILCIGAGAGKRDVEDRIAAGATNIQSLPYQPLAQINTSLSAADVHVVAMGDDMVGIVHPCKVYGAMAVSRPLLLIGPAQCHIHDLIQRFQCGWRIEHGDLAGAQRVLAEILATPEAELRAMGQRAAAAISQEMSRSELLGKFCDVLQSGLPPPKAIPALALGAAAP